jgi:organic radical activating enzyme
MKTYTVNEMFWSPQGEGMRAGEMSLFIRFTGCNMLCAMEAGPKSPGGFDCDTEFASGRKMTLEELVAQAKATCNLQAAWWEQGAKPWVVFTGGEPGLQVDKALTDALHEAGFMLAIETNGSIDLTGRGLDWITVSPKVAEHAIRQLWADEVKYVRGYGQALPKPTCKAKHQLISPAFNGLIIDRKALEWCVGLITTNPEWRLSIQMHKAWGVR